MNARRLTVALSLALVSACSDTVAPCPEGCSGPARLEIRDFTITLPTPGPDTAQPVAYSGDTVRIHLKIANRGEFPGDSTRLFISTPWQYDSTIAYVVPPLRAGGSFVVDTFMVLQRILPAHVTFSSVGAGLLGFDEVGIGVYASREFIVRPTTLTVPAPRPRYPSENLIDVVIDNPAPRALAGGWLTVCMPYDFDCAVGDGELASVTVPDLAPGERRVVQVRLPLLRTPDNDAEFIRRWPIRVLACLGADPERAFCSNNIVDVTPDFEQFCAVHRISLGVLVTSTTVARCGSDTTDRLDVLSFDAVAGTVYDVTVSGVSRIRFFAPSGDPQGSVTESSSIQMGRTGRYYLLVDGPGAYTIRIAPR